MKNKIRLLIFFLLEMLVLIIVVFIYKNIFIKKQNINNLANSYVTFYQKNSNDNFQVNKTILYSSAYGNNNMNSINKNDWSIEIYQYTDLAIYIKPKNENFFVKKIWIDTLNVSTPPVIGNASVFYENPTNFGTEYIQKDFPFNEFLEFDIVNDKNELNEIQYNTPVFFSDCSIPLTLKYVNTLAKNFNLKTSYTLNQNGTILNNIISDTSVIESDFSFVVHLIDNNNSEYKTIVNITVPLKNTEKNILTNGNILEINKNINNVFIKDN